MATPHKVYTGYVHVGEDQYELTVPRAHLFANTRNFIETVVTLAEQAPRFPTIRRATRYAVLDAVATMAYAVNLSPNAKPVDFPPEPARLLAHVLAFRQAANAAVKSNDTYRRTIWNTSMPSVEAALDMVPRRRPAALRKIVLTEMLRGIDFVPNDENIKEHAASLLQRAISSVVVGDAARPMIASGERVLTAHFTRQNG